MREFLLSVIAVVVLSIIFEVVFPAKRMKGALSLVFSLAMIFILSNGIQTDIYSPPSYEKNFLSILPLPPVCVSEITVK